MTENRRTLSQRLAESEPHRTKHPGLRSLDFAEPPTPLDDSLDDLREQYLAHRLEPQPQRQPRKWLLTVTVLVILLAVGIIGLLAVGVLVVYGSMP